MDYLDSEQVVKLHSHQFSKPQAGWIRLFILASSVLCPGVEAGSQPGHSVSEGFLRELTNFAHDGWTALFWAAQLIPSGLALIRLLGIAPSRRKLPRPWLFAYLLLLSTITETGLPKGWFVRVPQLSYACSHLGAGPRVFVEAMSLEPQKQVTRVQS